MGRKSLIPKKLGLKGFTLLELIVVLAGLGILSSLAIPNYMKYLDYAQLDEIKSLLNVAAADCLQKKRSETDPTVDDQIISDPIIEKSGYKINFSDSILDDNNNPKCSLLLLEPINGDDEDRVRYNIGFQLLSNGKLDKLASTNMELKRPDCIKWAGTCKVSQCAKNLEDYKEQIRVAKTACDTKLKEWKKTMSPEQFQQWDVSKGPDTCPLTPPPDIGDKCDESYKNTSSCTPYGCDLDIWGLWNDETNKGTTYNTKTAYEEARQALIGEKCAKQIKDDYENAIPPFTNPSSAGVELSECEYKSYWFVDGVNVKTQQKWIDAMCQKDIEDKKETQYTDPSAPSTLPYCGSQEFYFCAGEDKRNYIDWRDCLITNQSAACRVEIDDVRLNGEDGKHENSTQGPAPCGSTFWICDKEIKYTEDDYKLTSCGSCVFDDFMCQATGDPQYCC